MPFGLLLMSLILVINSSLQEQNSWINQQISINLVIPALSSAGKGPITLPVKNCENFTLLLIILLQTGDIEPNPGRRGKQATVFPCGLCEIPVTWISEGVCCDSCNIWHHKSCIELCTEDYELFQKSNVQWICCKCKSINDTSLKYHTYEIDSFNYYEPLTYPESQLDSQAVQKVTKT
jgi:hypothetical protein